MFEDDGQAEEFEGALEVLNSLAQRIGRADEEADLQALRGIFTESLTDISEMLHSHIARLKFAQQPGEINDA